MRRAKSTATGSRSRASYRADYDLSKHDEYGDDAFTVFKRYDEPKTVERATVDPDMSVLGPEFGGGDAAAVAEARKPSPSAIPTRSTARRCRSR